MKVKEAIEALSKLDGENEFCIEDSAEGICIVDSLIPTPDNCLTEVWFNRKFEYIKIVKAVSN